MRPPLSGSGTVTPLHRGLLLTLMLTGALTIIASACSSSSAPETTTTIELAPSTSTSSSTSTSTTELLPQHPVGGEVVIAVDEEPATLNLFVADVGERMGALISQGYAAGVYEIDGDTLMLVPELVTELPTVANGGVVLNGDGTMTIKYRIREEAQWDDGTPISGEDFQFTLDTIMNPDYPIIKTNYQDIITSAAGAKTFEYTMERPNLEYELMFGEIIPKHSVEGTDFVGDWNDKRWASSGPFIFEEWGRGEFIRLVRNPNYWKVDAATKQRLPYLDSVTFRFIADTSSMVEAFKARDIDVFSPDPTIEHIETLQAVEPQGARVEVLSGPAWEHLNFQFGPGRLDRNENSCNESYEMRLAIAQTIDKNLLTDDILGSKVEPLQSYVGLYSPTMSQEAWLQYTLDPDAAAGNYAKAIEATGKECAVVFTTTSRNDARVRMSELFVDMFAASGIAYENQLEDSMIFFGETIQEGSWDVGAWAWEARPDISWLIAFHSLFDPEAPPPEGLNFYRWGSEDSSVVDESTARFSEILDDMSATFDVDELRALVREAENILADNLVIIPLYAHLAAAVVWEDEIGGFKHNPTRAGFTWNIEFWHRVDL